MDKTTTLVAIKKPPTEHVKIKKNERTIFCNNVELFFVDAFNSELRKEELSIVKEVELVEIVTHIVWLKIIYKKLPDLHCAVFDNNIWVLKNQNLRTTNLSHFNFNTQTARRIEIEQDVELDPDEDLNEKSYLDSAQLLKIFKAGASVQEAFMPKIIKGGFVQKELLLTYSSYQARVINLWDKTKVTELINF